MPTANATCSTLQLEALPAFTDNYIWMLHDGREAWVVDPGDAQVVQDRLAASSLTLVGILVTHHHPDHIGGVPALMAQWQCPVLGPAQERTGVDHTRLAAGSRVACLGVHFDVLEIPGHTLGHIAYVQADGPSIAIANAPPWLLPAPAFAPVVFCGDTLFSGGCGRVFEGTPEQMHRSLQQLAALPQATRVCCTHEYTLSNLRFAAAVEPGNADVDQHRVQCEQRRAQGQATLPSTIGIELNINPFVRCTMPSVVAGAQPATADVLTNQDPVAVLACLREWKNRFS